MKQHITQLDIDILSKELRNKLYREFNNPLLSIGQMIEILGNKNAPKNLHIDFENPKDWENVCDDLWEGVKEILEQ